MDPVTRQDERRHPPGAAATWSEVFTWEAQPVGPAPAVTVRLVLHADRAWYLAAVAVPDRRLAVVTDLDVPLPSSPTSLEVRTSGLWADHNVETPFAHVSLGLEAFGVALDDPADALTDGFGERIPVGFDLEWEDDRPPVTGLAPGRYEVPGRAHGEVLLGAEAFEIDGSGQREHAWGDLGWWDRGWWRASMRWADGRHTVARGPALAPPGDDRSPAGLADGWMTVAPGRALTGGAGSCVPDDRRPAAIGVRWDDWGLPVAARLVLDATVCDLDPEVSVPVPLAPGGPALMSVLVASREPAGRGWLELVGPPHHADPVPGPTRSSD